MDSNHTGAKSPAKKRGGRSARRRSREFALQGVYQWPIERAILLIGTYELKNTTTPYRVVINEAVELAKSFGGSDGFKYVNGVLDKMVPELRPYEVVKGKNA